VEVDGEAPEAGEERTYDAGEVEYDLAQWTGESVVDLLNALTRQRVPHRWESTEMLLTVAVRYEADVNGLVFPEGAADE
jgi:hypothetical protein